MPKKTPWFPGEASPARDGVYERDHRTWGLCYSLYLRGRWKFPHATPLGASIQEIDSDCQREPWRGLTEAPAR